MTVQHINNFLTSTQKWQVNILVSLFFLFGITSCEDPVTTIGSELLQSSDIISTNFTDTLTIKTSTVLMDSTRTSSTDKLVVGRYIDPIFGTMLAKSYFQIANVDSIKANENSILDSVVLNLGYKYYLGDTLAPQSISVHRVLDKIGQNTGSLTKRLLESLDSKNTYYINDHLNYDPTPLGTSGTFYARPVIKKRASESELDSMRSISIRLNNSFGQELLAQSGKSGGAGLVNFKEYFKGMVLVPGSNENAAILGFEPNNTPASKRIKPSYMGLYYHTKDQKDTLVNYFFVSFTSNEAFNNRFYSVDFDRTNTVLKDLKKPNDTIGAQYENKEVYIQSTSGIATKIEIPYLKSLVKDGNIAINKVELLLSPKKLITGSLPSIALNLVLVNPKEKNKPLRTATGELSALPSEDGTTASLAYYNSTKQEYAFNITSYINQILLGKLENNGLFVTAASDYRLNRLVLDKTSIKLRIFYSKLGK